MLLEFYSLFKALRFEENQEIHKAPIVLREYSLLEIAYSVSNLPH